jgi:hypothetical protein
MKYYCIGNAVQRIALAFSPRLFDSSSKVNFEKLPLTKKEALTAFNESEELILFKTLEDAKIMRLANIKSAIDRGTILENNPPIDYPIYFLEIDDNININFTHLSKISEEQRIKILSFELYSIAKYNKSRLPDIEVSIVTKSSCNPQLIASHYYSLQDDHDELAEPSCSIL